MSVGAHSPADLAAIHDDEDVAVVLALVAALGAPAGPPTQSPRTVWARPAHQLRGSPAPGGDIWWTSGLPH